MSEGSAIVLKDVTYCYTDGERQKIVLDSASCDIPASQCVALLGPSGVGKTTILNLISGIDLPQTGSIEVAGKKLQHLEEPRLTLFRRRHIGFVYQFFNLIPLLTVAENLALPLELNGAAFAGRDEKIGVWLQQIGLADRADAYPEQLSGGEQQRVAIARALIHAPRVILADEPTGNLDAEHGRLVLDMLLDFARERNNTLLIVTHSREVAAAADQVLELRDGKIIECEASSVW